MWNVPIMRIKSSLRVSLNGSTNRPAESSPSRLPLACSSLLTTQLALLFKTRFTSYVDRYRFIMPASSLLHLLAMDDNDGITRKGESSIKLYSSMAMQCGFEAAFGTCCAIC